MLLKFESTDNTFLEILSNNLCAIDLRAIRDSSIDRFYKCELRILFKCGKEILFNLAPNNVHYNLIKDVIDYLDTNLVQTNEFSKVIIGKYSTFYYNPDCICGFIGNRLDTNSKYPFKSSLLLEDRLTNSDLGDDLHNDEYGIIFSNGSTYYIYPSKLSFDELQRRLELKNL